MNFSAIHHVAIIVSDYEASREFYVERLGFEVVRAPWRPEERGGGLERPARSRSGREPYAPESQPARPSYPEACGLRHLAFRVGDIEAAVAELAERCIECEPVRTDDFTGERMTFFSDPDGLPLELHE